MKIIEKIKLINFKRFTSFDQSFSNNINLLIGDNESGKSSILTAIELVASGSRAKVEALGLENLFNTAAVHDFLNGQKEVENLPKIYLELYLNELDNPDLFGRNNLDGIKANGIRMICEPNEELTGEIKQVLDRDAENFPFEYYNIQFKTFAGESYTAYRKFLRYLSLDSSQINSEYATKEYIKTVYETLVEHPQRINLKNSYRQQKKHFKDNHLNIVNDKLDDYEFAIRSGQKSNLDTDLTITEDEVPIDNRGKGRQCFIKTEFALKRYGEGQTLDTLLLEEPENHLSHTNMKRLINRISESEAKQIFIATHNSLISTRLDLRKSILLNSTSQDAITLNELPTKTAEFFMKAPDNNILEFILSSRVILVEGNAEYILIGAMYTNHTHSTFEADDVHIISVGGISFKRYLDLAKLLGIRTAVIRDNDGDANANCVENYKEYRADNIEIFYEPDNSKNTFEICLYELNREICDDLFGVGRKTLSVQDYMLKNKAECAFALLDKKSEEIKHPDYISQAIQWIKE